MRALPLCLVAAGLALSLAFSHDVALARVGASAPMRTARRIKRFTSLTGLWSGSYRYSNGFMGPVPFNARIEESGEHFSGEIDEPNTYADPSAPRLFATIDGSRHGTELNFVKTMDGTGGASHAIFYEGVVDGEFTRIDGAWTVEGLSGTFFMERAGVEAEAAEQRSAGATGDA